MLVARQDDDDDECIDISGDGLQSRSKRVQTPVALITFTFGLETGMNPPTLLAMG